MPLDNNRDSMSDTAVFTDRLVISFFSDISDDNIRQFFDSIDLMNAFDGARNVADATVIFFRLRVAVTPIPYDFVLAHRRELEGRGMKSFDYERVSFLPERIAPTKSVVPVDALVAMNVVASHSDGAGITIAMLDAGFDIGHPDFIRQRFFPAPLPQLPLGILQEHGTHGAGIAAGPLTPTNGSTPRYGVAPAANITLTRVITRIAIPDEFALAGIELAMSNKADIVCMCFGTPVPNGGPFSQPFEDAVSLAAKDVLLIAAAGNAADTKIHAVEHPANCPSVMAVAALDDQLRDWDLSCRQTNPNQEINVAAPGYELLSSLPGATYGRRSGTSPATACVAGIAALWAEAKPGLRGAALQAEIENACASGTLDRLRAGHGLVQAPP